MVIGYFQRNRNAINNMVMQMSGKGNQSKSWSMSEPSISGKGKSKQNQRESKGTKIENKDAKGHAKVKSWNWDRLITRTDRGFTRNGALMKGTMAGVLTGGLTMGMVLSGVKIVNKHMSLQARFRLKARNGRK